MSERNIGNNQFKDANITPAQAAGSLGIPPEQRHEPNTERLIELLSRLDSLQSDMSVADAHSMRAAQKGELINLPYETNPGDDALTLSSKYMAAEHLLRAASAILKEGLGGRSTGQRGYAASKANVAMNRIGYKVVPFNDKGLKE